MSHERPVAKPPATVSLDDEEGVKRILVDTLSALWATVNNLTRLRPTRRERYRRGLVEWARASMLRPGFELANPADMKIPRYVNTADEAIAIVRASHAAWRQAQDGPKSVAAGLTAGQVSGGFAMDRKSARKPPR